MAFAPVAAFAAVGEGHPGVAAEEQVRGGRQGQGAAVQPGQVGALRWDPADLRQVLVQQPAEQVAVAAQVAEHAVQPVIAPVPGHGVRQHAQGGGAVAGEVVQLAPAQQILGPGEDQLRALEASQVPGLGGRNRGDRLVRRLPRHCGVRQVGAPGIHQRGVDLVGEHARIVAFCNRGDAFQFRAGIDLADRVVWIAQQQHARASVEGRLQCVLVQFPVVPAAVHGHLQHRMAKQGQQRQEGHVARHRHGYRRARRQVMARHHFQRGQHVGHGLDRVGWHFPAVMACLPVRAGLGQGVQWRGGEIADLGAFDRFVQGGADRWRDAEVHLGHEGADAVGKGAPLQPTASAQLLQGDAVESRSVHADVHRSAQK